MTDTGRSVDDGPIWEVRNALVSTSHAFHVCHYRSGLTVGRMDDCEHQVCVRAREAVDRFDEEAAKEAAMRERDLGEKADRA